MFVHPCVPRRSSLLQLPSRSFRRTLESEDSDDCETDASSEGTDSTFDTRSATSGIHYLRHRSCRVMPPGLDNLGRKKSATSSLSPSSDDTIDSTSCTTATASKTYSSSYFSTSTSFTKSQSTGTISERTSSTRSASSFSFNELDPENGGRLPGCQGYTSYVHLWVVAVCSPRRTKTAPNSVSDHARPRYHRSVLLIFVSHVTTLPNNPTLNLEGSSLFLMHRTGTSLGKTTVPHLTWNFPNISAASNISTEPSVSRHCGKQFWE